MATLSMGLPSWTEPITMSELWGSAARTLKARSLAWSGRMGSTAENTLTPFTRRPCESNLFLAPSTACCWKPSTCFFSSSCSLIYFWMVPSRSLALLKRFLRARTMSSIWYIISSVSRPVLASIRRIPAATLASETILNIPIWPVLRAWIPPQNSHEGPKRTTRTLSPYFSPKRAIAPIFLASSIGVSRCSSSGKS